MKPGRRLPWLQIAFMRKSAFAQCPKVFPCSSLPTADLVIDAVYEGGTKGNTADDVLGKLIPGAGNQGGFRAVGSWDAPRLVILYSSTDDPTGLISSTCKAARADIN